MMELQMEMELDMEKPQGAPRRDPRDTLTLQRRLREAPNTDECESYARIANWLLLSSLTLPRERASHPMPAQVSAAAKHIYISFLQYNARLKNSKT